MKPFEIPTEGFIYDLIVLMHGLPDMTIQCLSSINQSMGDENYRIILIDNASKKEDGEAVLKFLSDHNINNRYIRNPINLGFIKGSNMGLAMSTAPYVVFQNNDTIVYPGCYQTLRRVCDMPNSGAVGSVSSSGWQNIERLDKKWNEFHEMDIPSDPLDRATLLRERLSGKTRTVSGMVAFFCTMFRREVIRKVGYLSEQYNMGFGDDDDYCERIRRAGYSICVALDVYVHHDHRTTWKTLRSQEEIRAMQDESMRVYKDMYGKGV